MRSVNVERKSRKAGRTQAVRPANRSGRELPSVQPGSARRGKEPGIFARLAERLSLFIRRPVMAMCGVLAVLVLLGALDRKSVV